MPTVNAQKAADSVTNLDTWLGSRLHQIGREMPEGYTLRLEIGRGCGGIALVLDATGDSVDFSHNGDFYTNINKAFAYAVLHSACEKGFEDDAAEV